MGITDIKLHHTIWTPELVELSLPLAGIARRCLARAIDQAILTILYLGIVLLAAINIFGSYTASIIVGVIGIVLADFVYFYAFHSYAKGQTPGKMIMKIRVVTPRGGRINSITSLLRSLFGILDTMLFWGGVSALMILATDQEKRIADFAAGTIVISELS